VPRFQSPPRRTPRADFPHDAHLFASCQGLWNLSCWGDFRRWSSNSIAVEQLRVLVEPLPTPPRPTEALSFPRMQPQKRQDVSAFALTYSLRLRSCKLMDAFVISSLPSRLKETLQTAGPPRSVGVTPLPRYYGPDRHPLAFDRLPGLAGYTIYLAPVISHPGRGELHQLLGVSLSPCCRFHPAEVELPHQSDFGTPCCLRPTEAGSALGSRPFEATSACTFVTARRLVDLSKRDLVDRLQDFGFPPPCYPNYGAPDFCPGRSVSC
jgi:hypothetical protein